MSYLELLEKLEGYNAVQTIITGEDSSTILSGLQGLFGKSSVALEQFAPESMEGARGQKYELTDPESFFSDAKSLLFYPEDLFQPGNTAYIYFQIKDSQDAAFSQTDYDSFGGNPLSDVKIDAAKPKKRIAMYMPPAIKVNYGTKWEDANLTIRRDLGIGKAIYQGGSKGIGDQLLAKLFDQAVGGTPAGNDTEFAQKKILDPQAALLFKGVNFREFQFDFQMLARSKTETEIIRQIIKTFKYAMHPGSTAGTEGAIWNYPYFFEIYLCSPSRKFMFNIMSCALTTMEVDYGGSGIPSFFRENGAPVDIRLSLQFKELYVLTKDMILKDF